MIYIIIFALFVFLVVIVVALFLYINSDKSEVEPYKPIEPEKIEEQIKEIDKKIETIDKEVYNEKTTSNNDILQRFRTINRH